MKHLTIFSVILIIFINILTLIITIDSFIIIKQVHLIDTTLSINYIAVVSAVRLHTAIIVVTLFIACIINYSIYTRVVRRGKARKELFDGISALFADAIEGKESKDKSPVKEAVSKYGDFTIDPVFERKIDDIIQDKSKVGSNITKDDIIRHKLNMDDNDDVKDKTNKERVRLGITDDTFRDSIGKITGSRSKIRRDVNNVEGGI